MQKAAKGSTWGKGGGTRSLRETQLTVHREEAAWEVVCRREPSGEGETYLKSQSHVHG